MIDDNSYDEFDSIPELVAELGLSQEVQTASRVSIDADDGSRISAIKWGGSDPELVFLHGSGQNAHTWDGVALALGRAALAIDLPGHGHSSWREDRDYSAHRNARSLAPLIEAMAPAARIVVGMSLGGSTTIRLAAQRPDLVRKAVLVDVTPGTREAARAMDRSGRGSVALILGPRTYPSFEAMADAAIALSPKRPAAATRRGVRNNARQLEDGQWTWRYDRLDLPGPAGAVRHASLWDDVADIKAPLMLVIGGKSQFVRDEDVLEMRRRQPHIRVERVAEAGHSVQSYAPLTLAALIDDFLLS